MGKSSRQKRRTYQTPKRARTSANLVWYVAAAILVIGGSLAVALSRSNSASGVGPQTGDHWHAALGVDVCGQWTPNWQTPFASSGPVRAGSNVYAGLHSHGDGIIHMEPSTTDEMGKHATVGEYFKFAGFKVSATSISFVSVNEKNGDKCGGKPGVLRWEVNGKEHHGNPASYKLYNGDVVAIVFTTADATLPKKTDVPSYQTLQGLIRNPGAPTPAPGSTAPSNVATTTTPTSAPGATTTTAAGSTTTSTPAGATSTSKP
jgi:hypothetical protein